MPVGLRILLFIIGVTVVLWAAQFFHLRRFGYKMFRFPPAETPRPFAADRVRSFRGAGRIAFVHSGAPFAKLTFDDHQAVFSGLIYPAVPIPRRYCTAVRRFGASGTHIRFDSADGRYDGLWFWSSKASEVALELRELGWPVEELEPRLPTAGSE